MPQLGRRIRTTRETVDDDGENSDEDENEKIATKKVSKKKAREAAKSWSKEKMIIDESKMDSFIKKHTKEIKRYIEAIYV